MQNEITIHGENAVSLAAILEYIQLPNHPWHAMAVEKAAAFIEAERQVRDARILAMAQEEMDMQAAETPAAGLKCYTPELGDAKPAADIEARIGHYGNWYLTTALELKGRGITAIFSHDGKNRYRVTDKAFEKLEKQYSISHESRLD